MTREKKREGAQPTGAASSGLQAGPMRREERGDDLIPVGDSGEETIGRRAARTAKEAGLEAEDEDEGL